jgi:VIT1/CCC1 family predicted Fe2+/Mn2+ transporter
MIMVMGGMLERSKKSQLIIRLRGLDDEGARVAAVQQEVEPVIAPYVEKAERAAIYSSIATRLRDGEPERIHPKREEVLGAFATAWIVFACSLPAVLPFLLLEDRFMALRTSNALLLAALFLVGYRWALATHSNPWRVGGALMLTGLIMVLIAIPLGG